MNILFIWPCELNVPNRAPYQRIKVLSKHYQTYLVTMDKGLIDEEIRQNVKVLALPFIRKLSYLLYIVNMFVIVSASLLRRKETIIYVIYNWTILPAMILSLMTRMKVFVDFLDDPYLITEALKSENRKTLKFYIYLVVNYCFYHFATKTKNIIGFSSIGLSQDSMLPKIFKKRYSIDSRKLIAVPNGADLTITYTKNRSKNHKPLRIIYVGYINPRRQVNTLIQALDRMDDNSIELILVGQPATNVERGWLKHLIGERNWISYKGLLPHDEVLRWIDVSNVCFYTASKDVTNYRYTHPIKVFEYLAMGKPVVAPRFEGVMDVIRDGYNGFLFDPEHPEEIIEIIRKHYMEFINGEYFQNALSSVKPFDWNTINKAFLSQFQRIVSSMQDGSD